MTLSEIKEHLATAEAVNFILPDGSQVPNHFHVTEVGQVTKHFIDCGGTVRSEKTVSFQLWTAQDTDHRLYADKLLHIIALSEKMLGIEDATIEVEYQTDTIGRYGVNFNGTDFLLTPTHTACLAQDECGIPTVKSKLPLSALSTGSKACAPNSGCCS